MGQEFRRNSNYDKYLLVYNLLKKHIKLKMIII